MVLNYDYTTDDYVNFVVYRDFHPDRIRKEGKLIKIIYILLFTAIAIVVPLVSPIHFFIIFPISILATFISVRSYNRDLQRRIDRTKDQAYKDALHMDSFGKVSTQLLDHGIAVSTKNDERVIEWEYIVHIEEVKEYIFIFTALDDQIIIPKTAFIDQDMVNDFFEITNKNLNK